MLTQESLSHVFTHLMLTLTQIWTVVEPTLKPALDTSHQYLTDFYRQQSQEPDPIKILIAIAMAIISLIIIVQTIMSQIIFGTLIAIVGYILYLIFHHG